MEIVLPEGAGVVYDGDEVNNFLRSLTRTLEEKGLVEKGGFGLGGEWNYGANFENSIFLLHRYCWCEKEDCSWCSGCTCPDSAFHCFIDGNEVSYQEFDEYYRSRVLGIEDSNWEAISREVNTHRTQTHIPTCDFCLNSGPFGKIPGRPAPNFWHKPSGFRAWWYKWIGRSMEVENSNNTSIDEIKRSCMSSLRGSLNEGKK